MNNDVLDRAALLEELGNDQEFLKESLAMLCEDAPALLREIRSAANNYDTETLWKRAHSMKSMVGNFFALRSFDLACQLETMGRQGDLTNVVEGIGHLEVEIQRLITAIERLVD